MDRSQVAIEQEEVFRLVDVHRWRRGQAQVNWQPRRALILVGFLSLLAAVDLWRVAEGQEAVLSSLDWSWFVLLPLWVQVAVIWIEQGRELVVSATHLRMRYPVAWLDRWLGWQVLLSGIEDAQWELAGVPGLTHPLDYLFLIALKLRVPSASTWTSFGTTRFLQPASWAPLRGGRVEPGPWPGAEAPSSSLRVFRRQVPLTDAVATPELEARLAQLPLVCALRERGAKVPPLGRADGVPARLVGQLDLGQVPVLRYGMFGLATLFGLSVWVIVASPAWRFFTYPWALYGYLAAACALLCAGLLWPRKLDHQPGLSPEQARGQARVASVFVGLLSGALLAWLLTNGLLWWTGRTQPVQRISFALDKTHIDPGPILLLPVEGGDAPAIEIDSGVSFWRKQPDGMRFTLAVARMPLGDWWIYDGGPIDEAMHKQ